MIRVLIAGEGANEIGTEVRDAAHEGERPTGGGVIEAFAGKVRPSGWQIRRTAIWHDITKLRVNAPGKGDERTVNVLILQAQELGCRALIFLRDTDDDPRRRRTIHDAVAHAPKNLLVVGGVPIQMLENWLLAFRGEVNAHAEARPVDALHERHGVPPKQTTAMVQLVRNNPLRDTARDAGDFRRWLRGLANALNVKVPTVWP
jgi:hypothetical protein